jgi:hypothetical protein
VATINRSTRNLHFLEGHDYISKPQNCLVLRLTEPPFEHEGAGNVRDPPPLPCSDGESGQARCLRMWTPAEVGKFFEEHDMPNAARTFVRNDVSGVDLDAMTQELLVQDLGMSPFLAKKNPC